MVGVPTNIEWELARGDCEKDAGLESFRVHGWVDRALLHQKIGVNLLTPFCVGLGNSYHLDIGAFEHLCRLQVSYKFRPITYIGSLLTNNQQVGELYVNQTQL